MNMVSAEVLQTLQSLASYKYYPVENPLLNANEKIFFCFVGESDSHADRNNEILSPYKTVNQTKLFVEVYGFISSLDAPEDSETGFTAHTPPKTTENACSSPESLAFRALLKETRALQTRRLKISPSSLGVYTYAPYFR